MLSEKVFISCDVRVLVVNLRGAKSIERLHTEVTLNVAKESRSYSPEIFPSLDIDLFLDLNQVIVDDFMKASLEIPSSHPL
jgi:hypothetical protein